MTTEQILKLDEITSQIAHMKGRIEFMATNRLADEAKLRQHLVDIYAEMQNWQESIGQVQFPPK
jgi:TolA-binding protein|tara:strand:+ start:558 stop:749 length:192 start_codon:yes stop_codon:yes gene_type:complete